MQFCMFRLMFRALADIRCLPFAAVLSDRLDSAALRGHAGIVV
jgi:hypothetical protein